MSPTVALVASSTSPDGAQMLALRLRHLLELGWDAWLFCKGDRWRDEAALRDPDLRGRIELAPDAKANSSPFDRRLRSLQPDIVHFTPATPPGGAYARGSCAARRSRSPSGRMATTWG